MSDSFTRLYFFVKILKKLADNVSVVSYFLYFKNGVLIYFKS